jgi:hypothetical protein
MSAPRGRPPTCTPELAARVRALQAQGFALTTACRIAGIDRSTYYRHQRQPGPELCNSPDPGLNGGDSGMDPEVPERAFLAGDSGAPVPTTAPMVGTADATPEPEPDELTLIERDLAQILARLPTAATKAASAPGGSAAQSGSAGVPAAFAHPTAPSPDGMRKSVTHPTPPAPRKRWPVPAAWLQGEPEAWRAYVLPDGSITPTPSASWWGPI